MKRFRFSLQALQILRRRQENEAFQRYATAVQARTRAQEALLRVEAEREAGWGRLREQMARGGQVMELLQIELWCQSVETRRTQSERALVTAQDQVAQRWQELLAARQAREVVDKFYENQKRTYDRALLREEQKELDELAKRCTPTLSVMSESPVVSWN